MKCEILFSGIKYFKISHDENFPSMQSVTVHVRHKKVYAICIKKHRSTCAVAVHLRRFDGTAKMTG